MDERDTILGIGGVEEGSGSISYDLDEYMTDKEALEILRKTTIILGRKNKKLSIYLALYKAYYALKEKVEKESKEG